MSASTTNASPTAALAGKRPPSISGETFSIATRTAASAASAASDCWMAASRGTSATLETAATALRFGAFRSARGLVRPFLIAQRFRLGAQPHLAARIALRPAHLGERAEEFPAP